MGVDDCEEVAIMHGLGYGYVVCSSENQIVPCVLFIYKKNPKNNLTVFSFMNICEYHYELLNYVDSPCLAIFGRQKQNKQDSLVLLVLPHRI